MSIWQALRERNLIGSDAAIVLACALHTFEATVFLATATANGSVGMAALIMVFRLRWLAALALCGSVAFAVIAEWVPGLSRFQRFSFLFPQFLLLMITSVLGGIAAVLVEHYADGVPRPWTFIACDQAHRIIGPVWYGIAILARIREP